MSKIESGRVSPVVGTPEAAANVRLYRLAAEILGAVEPAFPAPRRLALSGLPGPEPVLGVGVSGRRPSGRILRVAGLSRAAGRPGKGQRAGTDSGRRR